MCPTWQEMFFEIMGRARGGRAALGRGTAGEYQGPGGEKDPKGHRPGMSNRRSTMRTVGGFSKPIQGVWPSSSFLNGGGRLRF